MESSAIWMLGAGIGAAVLAVIAWLADRARSRRTQLDRVGLVPWTGVFFWSTMIAVLLLGAAARAVF